jgi:hypothetical protein
MSLSAPVPLPNAPDFDPALGDLQDHLPYWWRTQDPTSQIYALLTGVGSIIDLLSALWEQPYLDQVLTTASPAGVMRNFQLAWGLSNEQVSSVQALLVAYIQLLASDDGSLQSAINALSALLTVPAGHAALEYPVLIFPPDGSGLQFPADGSGLTFGVFELLYIEMDYLTYTMTVYVLDWLDYDPGTFAREVQRFVPADWNAATIVPVPILPWTIAQLEGTYLTVSDVETVFSTVTDVEDDVT